MDTLTIPDGPPATAARGATRSRPHWADRLTLRREAAGTRDRATTAGQAPATRREGLRSIAAWPRHEQLGLLALLLGTAAFYFFGLTQNGYANSFYSAAVQAGSQNWEAFLFGSSDAANSITVDKPPAALWFMALSVRLFGLNSFAILMPEVLMGVATVGVVYATVRRYADHLGGMIAGVVLALTPVAVLMFRFNNPDALLVFLLTLATWATLRAVEKASPKWLIWTGVFLGFGFLTKTLQAFLILPVLGLIYLICAPTTLRKRITHSLAAFAAMIVSAGWWVALVELVPESMRPYVGGSQTNSFLELTFGYNGLGRINGNETGSVGGGGGWGSTGITRLFSSDIGGQIAWFIPSALILLAAGLWLTRRAPRTDLVRASYLAWGGWLIVTGLIFSFMQGIFHQYYTVALAPAIAALVGLGVSQMWRRRDTSFGSIVLAFATAAAATWSFILLTGVSTSYGPLRFIVFAVGMAAALLLLVISRVHAKAVPVIAGVALAAALAGPAAYSISTVTHGYTGSIVTAGPSSGGMGGPGGGGAPGGQGGQMGTPPGSTAGGTTTQGTQGATSTSDGATGRTGAQGGMGGLLDASTPSSEVIAALQADAGNYTWAAAAVGSQSAAGLQLYSGEPVMAIGGFNGSDPSPTLAQFQEYVAQGQIHYLLASSGMGGGSGSGTASQILSWAKANYQTVTIGSTTFYDLTQPLTSTNG